MMGQYGNHAGGLGLGAWIFMAVLMVMFWAGVIAVVVALVRHKGHDRAAESVFTGGSDGSALQILDDRFAHGDIDAEEYTTRRDVLQSR